MCASIAVLTDFGLKDTYVAAMKAVILSKLPSATILDLTHDIAPGDIAHGAFECWRIRPYLPEQTILLGVVDPGVGSSRRPIAIEFPGFSCVGPDNGLFSYLLLMEKPNSIVEIVPGELGLDQMSKTFHGRDLFAPAAAALAGGASIDELGPGITDLLRLPSPGLRARSAGSIQGEILHIDRFGNLISSIGFLSLADDRVHFSPWLEGLKPCEYLREQVRIQLEHAGPMELVDTFGDAPHGAPLAYIGSAGLLEIAVRDGNAAITLHVQRGDPVTLTLT